MVKSLKNKIFMSSLKKILYVGASLALILWSMGPVLPAKAVTISDGDLVKTPDSPAVYYIQGSTKRVFPHANVYWSWGYKDWSGVKVVSASDLAAYADGNPMPFRDGSLFRGKSSGLHGYPANAVYYVENATLRPIKSASIYQALFKDPQWKKVTWIPDDILDKFQYPLGSMIESAEKHPNGCLVKYEGETQVYLIQDGKKRAISDAGFVANRFRTKDIITISASEVYPDGDPITGKEEALLTPGWTTVAGALTVSLASDTPVAQNVPISAQNIPFTKIKIQTNSNPVLISAITVKRAGLGSASDFGKIGLFEGDVQIGTYKTLSSSTDSLTFTFGTPLNIPAYTTKYYTIKANFSGTPAGHVNKLGITAISANGTVYGLPVYGYNMTATDISIGSVTIDEGSVNNLNPKIGVDKAELAVIKLIAGSVEDLEFRSIKLKNNGTARSSDVANVGIYYLGEKKGDCSWSVDYLNCVLSSPFTVKKNETREFKILGDIEDGVGRTIILSLEEVYDLNVVGKSYGFSVPVTNNFSPTTITISAGEVALNFAGPEASDISQGQKDIVMANFEITSLSEDAELRTVYMAIKVNGNNPNASSTDPNVMENVELYDPETGAIYDGSAVSSGDYQYYWKFTPYVTLRKGVKKTFQLRLDTPLNKPANGTTLAAYFLASSGSSKGIELYGLVSRQYISDISPSSLDGKLMTVKAPGLKVTNVSLVNENIVAGTKGVPLLKAIFEASGEKIKVNSITFSQYTSGNFKDEDVDHLYLYKVDGSTETLIKSMSDSEFGGQTANFSGLNLSIEPGSNKAVTLVLKVDIASNATDNDVLKVKINASSNILAEDLDGDSITPTGSFPIVGREVTIKTSGTLSIDMDTSVAEVSKDRYVLAGTTTGWLGRIKLDASYEDVKINKLVLLAPTDSADSVISIKLYKADKTTEIATAYWTEGENKIIFDPLNYVVDDVGVDYLYIKAVLKKIGVGPDDTADSNDELKFQVSNETTATGVSSGKSITPTIGSNFSKSHIIVASRPANLENALADGTLSSGVQIIAKFKITANSTNNTNSSGEIADLLIKQLKITFMGNVSATDVTIERELGNDPAATVTSTDVVGTTQVINLESLLPNDYKIESGESATYVIKANISFSGTGQKYIQTKISGLNDPSVNAIIWNDEYNDFNTLRLDFTEVLGGKLTLNQ
jgi:hypothetical protein